MGARGRFGARRVSQVVDLAGEPSTCSGLKGSNEPWCELPLDVETLGSLQRSYPQVHMFPDMETHVPMVSVSIALLP